MKIGKKDLKNGDNSVKNKIYTTVAIDGEGNAQEYRTPKKVQLKNFASDNNYAKNSPANNQDNINQDQNTASQEINDNMKKNQDDENLKKNNVTKGYTGKEKTGSTKGNQGKQQKNENGQESSEKPPKDNEIKIKDEKIEEKYEMDAKQKTQEKEHKKMPKDKELETSGQDDQEIIEITNKYKNIEGLKEEINNIIDDHNKNIKNIEEKYKNTETESLSDAEVEVRREERILEELKNELNNLDTRTMNNIEMRITIANYKEMIDEAEKSKKQAIENRDRILNYYSKSELELQKIRKNKNFDNEIFQKMKKHEISDNEIKTEIALTTKRIDLENCLKNINEDINKINIKIDAVRKEMKENEYIKDGETIPKSSRKQAQYMSSFKNLVDVRYELKEKKDDIEKAIDLCNKALGEIKEKYEKQSPQGKEQNPGVSETQSQQYVEKIIISEANNSAIAITKDGKLYEEALSNILENKKETFKNKNIKSYIKKATKGIRIPFVTKIRLKRRVNPIIIAALTRDEDISQYIRDLKEKEAFNFELEHNLINSSLEKKQKKEMKRIAKRERKCYAIVNGLKNKMPKISLTSGGLVFYTPGMYKEDKSYKREEKLASKMKTEEQKELNARYGKNLRNDVQVSEEVKENIQGVSEAYATKGNGMTSEELAQNISPYLEK